MTYGSATTAEDVAPYMQHIFKNHVPDGLIADFENRYRLVGRSPLIDITKRQAELLEKHLHGVGKQNYIVRAAMLHSAPFINDVVLELKNGGAEELRGVILSPQFSSFIMDGYRAALTKAATTNEFPREAVSIAGPWPAEAHFIELLAVRVKAAMAKLEAHYGRPVPVLFTTHSLPERVVKKDPNYLKELQKTIDGVLAKLHMPELEWHAGYQSAGHTPEEWLKPDLTDLLEELRGKTPAVLIVPIQFLADHLEILYDLDIAAKAQCDERGIAYHRIELPNEHPLFIEALASITMA